MNTNRSFRFVFLDDFTKLINDVLWNSLKQLVFLKVISILTYFGQLPSGKYRS